MREIVGGSAIGVEGVSELESMVDLLAAAGADEGRIVIDPSVVRGLGYYTGLVYEAELTFEVFDDKGRKRQFGSVAGGGVLSKVSRRFGEGVVNGALTARVGVAAIEVCRPLPFHAAKRPSVTALVRRALTGLFGGN